MFREFDRSFDDIIRTSPIRTVPTPYGEEEGGNRERPDIKGQVVFKGDFNRET